MIVRACVRERQERVSLGRACGRGGVGWSLALFLRGGSCGVWGGWMVIGIVSHQVRRRMIRICSCSRSWIRHRRVGGLGSCDRHVVVVDVGAGGNTAIKTGGFLSRASANIPGVVENDVLYLRMWSWSSTWRSMNVQLCVRRSVTGKAARSGTVVESRSR